MKRIFDIILCIIAIIVLLVPMLFLALLVRFTSKGPILHWSHRVGLNNEIFKMPKFRSMSICAPNIATHLLVNPAQYITPLGFFLRKSSLDELPQLWSILIGDMSFVGPRPALFNQEELISMRFQLGIHKLIPGLTGWAQINGRNDISISKKVKLDLEYYQKQSILLDLKILYLTFLKVLKKDGVLH